MRHCVTGDVDNILDAFMALAEESAGKADPVLCPYVYPYPLMFNGDVLRPVKQLA